VPLFYLFQADITYITDNKIAKRNRNFRYLVTIIDVLSKQAYVLPLKRKSGPALTSSFRQLLESIKPKKPRLLRTDKGERECCFCRPPRVRAHVFLIFACCFSLLLTGTEFKNRFFARLCVQYDIRHYWAGNVVKASVVERFNRQGDEPALCAEIATVASSGL